MSYAECCKSNGIRWYRDGDALRQQYEAQLPQEGIESFEKYKQKFFTLFGREPVDGDLLLFDVSAHDSEFFRKGITFLRNLGLPKEWIYAYYRTDGLMPTIENEKYLSKNDLDLFGDYCREYTDLMDADFGDGQIVRCCSMAAIIAPSYLQTPCSGGFFIFRAWKPRDPVAPIPTQCRPIPWAVSYTHLCVC